jgi:hypothetical protein
MIMQRSLSSECCSGNEPTERGISCHFGGRWKPDGCRCHQDRRSRVLPCHHCVMVAQSVEAGRSARGSSAPRFLFGSFSIFHRGPEAETSFILKWTKI